MVIRKFCILIAIALMMLMCGCSWYETFGYYKVNIDDMINSNPEELLEDERYEYARINDVVYQPRIVYSKNAEGYSFYLLVESYSKNNVYVSEVVATSEGQEIFRCSDFTMNMEEYSGWPGVYRAVQEFTVFYDVDIEFYDGMIIDIVIYVGEDRIPIEYVAEVYEPDSVPWPT